MLFHSYTYTYPEICSFLWAISTFLNVIICLMVQTANLDAILEFRKSSRGISGNFYYVILLLFVHLSCKFQLLTSYFQLRAHDNNGKLPQFWTPSWILEKVPGGFPGTFNMLFHSYSYTNSEICSFLRAISTILYMIICLMEKTAILDAILDFEESSRGISGDF